MPADDGERLPRAFNGARLVLPVSTTCMCPGAFGAVVAMVRIKTHNQMRTLFMSAALCCAIAATAQTTPDKSPSELPAATAAGQHSCMMATDAELKSLGLSADQMLKAKDIQDRCAKACAVSMKEKGAMDHKAMDSHEKELMAVLTPEQTTAWQKWCATKKAAPEMKK